MRLPVKIFGLMVLTLLVLFLVTTAESCDESGKTDRGAQRRNSVETRAETFARAEKLHPIPNIKNFPLRQDLVDFALREDMLDHPWYVYIIADTGNVLGYYVARSVPVNSCTFLSSTEDVDYDANGNIIFKAPSLDGIYYGESGCDEWFFFDGATDAMIKIRGVKFFVADQPLKLEAEPILVADR